MITFLRDKKSPTMSLLEEWEMKEGNGANIDTLIAMIEEIDNVPALEVVKEVRGKRRALSCWAHLYIYIYIRDSTCIIYTKLLLWSFFTLPVHLLLMAR